MKVIRASELNTYSFCQRAWWYQTSGAESENMADLSMGEIAHERHARSIRIVGLLRFLAAILLLVSLALFTAYLATTLL